MRSAHFDSSRSMDLANHPLWFNRFTMTTILLVGIGCWSAAIASRVLPTELSSVSITGMRSDLRSPSWDGDLGQEESRDLMTAIQVPADAGGDKTADARAASEID